MIEPFPRTGTPTEMLRWLDRYIELVLDWSDPPAETWLNIRCAWCDRDMGQRPGHGQTGVTHSICDECLRKRKPLDNI